jgi:hypothetical protein
LPPKKGKKGKNESINKPTAEVEHMQTPNLITKHDKEEGYQLDQGRHRNERRTQNECILLPRHFAP